MGAWAHNWSTNTGGKTLGNKTHNQRVSYFHEPEVQVQRQRTETMSSEGDSQELSFQEEGGE